MTSQPLGVPKPSCAGCKLGHFPANGGQQGFGCEASRGFSSRDGVVLGVLFPRGSAGNSANSGTRDLTFRTFLTTCWRSRPCTLGSKRTECAGGRGLDGAKECMASCTRRINGSVAREIGATGMTTSSLRRAGWQSCTPWGFV